MKIISKHKDYYDHMVGVYGRDEHIVYDRRLSLLPENNRDLYFNAGASTQYEFYICGKIHRVVMIDGKSYHYNDKIQDLDWMDRLYLERNQNASTPINEKFCAPVLACRTFSFNKNKFFIPILSEFGFASQISAEDMYQKIYTFLSWLKDNPAPQSNQTDKEKVQSHGFDLKWSFRPKIKQ
jgi:hypothetical protein